MEKLQWFKFSIGDWRMGKIQRCPEITQIRFLNLCCLYWNKEAVLSCEDAEIEIDKEHLDILISKKIIEINKDVVSIKFLDEQLQGITETSKGKSKAAKSRWDKHNKRKALKEQKDTDAMHVHTDALQNDAEESRVEEIREENIKDTKVSTSIDFDKLLIAFNQITNKNCRVVNSKTRAQLKARLKDGYTKQNIKDAIINCYNDKFHKENNHKHLTLEFITRPDKLERYSQAVVTSQIVTKGKGIGLNAGDFFEDTTLFVSFISEEGTAVWKNTKDML